jgi:hypothetical protein
MLARLSPYLLLAALGLTFFVKLVLHPTQVLYSDHSDLLAEHIPAKRFLVESWHEYGELPLWCPYTFAGSPFIHDPEVAAFYPPHVLLYLLPGEAVGAALSWLAVAHVIVAGWAMCAYAAGRGLGRAGSLVAALGYMFAGNTLLHLLAQGHYVVVGLAWLPLVLLWLEGAIGGRGLLRAVWAGVAFALVVLGSHPQYMFYGGLFVALWTLGPALERAGYLGAGGAPSVRRLAGALGHWLACGGVLAVVAVALCAVQLLPAVEAAGLSSRSCGTAPPQNIGKRNLFTVLTLFGPSQGGLSVLWVSTALLALPLCRSRVLWPAFVGLLLGVFALGGGTALADLPGFRLFRAPSRMLLLAAVPLAYLAGAATQALVAGPKLTPRGRRRRALLLSVLLVALGLASASGQLLQRQLYWVSLFLTVPAAFLLLGQPSGTARWALAWGALLLIDLWALAWPLVEVQPEEGIYTLSPCVKYLAEHNQGHPRVLDRGWPADTPNQPDRRGTSPLGAGAPLAVLWRLEPARGYNPLDVLRYKEYLQFLGNEDKPLRGLGSDLTFPVVNDFPVKNPSLLDLLGTRYLLQRSDRPPVAGTWEAVDEDKEPKAYDCLLGGMQPFPPYTVYENPNAFRRAFIVHEAAPLPERPRVLAALNETDFSRRVLLEDFTADAESTAAKRKPGSAQIRDYQPNRVTVEVASEAPGYLVLTDIWYPGWTCTVDGEPARLYRGNFVFRAVAVPAGSHKVVFNFAPDSYRRGKAVSVTALIALALCVLAGVGRKRKGNGARAALPRLQRAG